MITHQKLIVLSIERVPLESELYVVSFALTAFLALLCSQHQAWLACLHDVLGKLGP